MKTWKENVREIPVAGEFDVIVAGAGPAGISAAIGAARNGAKTLLVEQEGCLGGVATAGLMSHWNDHDKSPIVQELQARCRAGAFKGENPSRYIACINQENAKQILLAMMEEAGVKLRLHSFVSAAAMDGKKLCGIITESKSGREMFKAKVVIDATGDGDLAARAGAEFKMGRPQDGRMQPATLMFKIGGVDIERAVLPESFGDKIQIPAGEIQALGAKHLPHPAGHVLLYRSTQKGFVIVNMTNMIDIDGTNTESVTKAEIECRKQIPLIMKFLNEYVPGYEEAFVISSASYVGIRETRHFKGLYTLTEDDIENGRRFDDWICHGEASGFDIHNVDGSGLDKNGGYPTRENVVYDIPYRCCIPETIDGLLLAGRCISGTHKAHANYRMMGLCSAIGLATGIASAISVKDGVAVRNVNMEKLHSLLMQK